jgi:hypothetical protein
MSTAKKTPQSVNTSQDPALEYLNQREIEVAITPTENSTKSVVFEEVTQVITNVFQVNAPSGANGQLQFNQGGQYIGDAELQYDPYTDTLTTGKIIANSITITGNANNFKLAGGYNNEVLRTDGNGNLSWANVFPSVSGKSGKFLVTNGVSIDWSTSNYNSFASTTYVDSAIATLVGTAPAMLDTLAEIANVIGQTNDPQYGIISQLANKANISSLAQVAFSGSYADLSNRPNISNVGISGNYTDLNGKPTIPATILDLGISDGTVGQVLTAYGNGNYHFTTVSGGGGGTSYDQGLNSTDDVEFNNITIGNISAPNGLNLTAGPVSWNFANAGALFFPQTPYVTSAILVNDNNQELSISTDRGSISIWPENSKWLFGADGNLTLPGNAWTVNYANGTTVPLSGAASTGNITFDNNIIRNTTSLGGEVNIHTASQQGDPNKSWSFNHDGAGSLYVPTGSSIKAEHGLSILATDPDFVNFTNVRDFDTNSYIDYDQISIVNPEASILAQIDPTSPTYAGGVGATIRFVYRNYLVKQVTIIEGFVSNGNDPFTGLPQYTCRIDFNTTAMQDLIKEISFGFSANWRFAPNGKLQLPLGGDIVDSTGTSVLGGGSGATTLSALTDVALEEPSQGQVLTWNNSQSKWQNQGLPSINEIVSYNADTSSNYSVSLSTTGVVTMTTARGGLEFGAMPEVGGPTHFHIMRPASENGSGGTDLYFGDDYNYVLQRPAQYGSNPAYGVEIGANDNNGGSQQVWRFGTDGKLTLPTAGIIRNGTGTTQVGATRTIATDSNEGTGAGTPNEVDVAYDNTIIPTYYYSGGGAPVFTDSTITFSNGDVRTITSITTESGPYLRIVYSGATTASSPEFPITLKTGNYAAATTAPEWTFGTDGKLTVPGTVTSADRLILNSAGVDSGYFAAVLADGNLGRVFVRTDDGTTFQTWEFNKEGKLILPVGGDIVDIAGQSVLGGGTVSSLVNGDNTVSLEADGNLTLPTGGTLIVSGGIVGTASSPAPYLSGFSSVSALQFTNGTSNVTINANSNLWNFDSTGNLTIPGSSGGFIKTVANASIGIVAVDNGTNNPAQLLSMTNAGAATSIISAYATNATIQTNATGTINTWAFDSTGNLTLPANAFAINYANGTQVSLGGSSSSIANGTSNISIATSNGNVTIAAVGNTTMTVTGTGANITGTLTSTGKIGYASGSTVTQTTNRGNGVNINALAGTIVTVSASMTAGEIGAFTVTNNRVDTDNDIVLVQVVSPNLGNYNVIANPNSGVGGFYVTLQNISGFPISPEAVTIRFMVIKAPNA